MSTLDVARWQFGMTTVHHFILGLDQLDEIVHLDRGQVVGRTRPHLLRSPA